MRKPTSRPSLFSPRAFLRHCFALGTLAAATTTPALAQRLSSSALEDRIDDDVVTLTDMEVESTQVQQHAYQGNMDLVRSENDIQPYTVFSRDVIERSGATSVEGLLRQELTMSTGFGFSDTSTDSFNGSSSQISLRGLGASQTLVLINGRRVAGVGRRGASEGSDQADLNGIPLSAIERIEILPASASAIYGSGALGGVVNVILRRGFSGHEFNARYETTDDGHAPIKTFSLSSSFQLEGGRTQLLLALQYQDTGVLDSRDRHFQVRGRNHELANNPDAIYVPAGQAGDPPAGALVNIRSANGSPLFGPGSSHFTHIPLGYRGWQLDGLQPLIDNQGHYNLDLVTGASNAFSGDETLVRELINKSAYLSASRQMTDRLHLFLDTGLSEDEREGDATYFSGRIVTLSASSPNNPFGQAIRVNYPVRHIDRETPPISRGIIRQRRAALGFELTLPRDWRLVGDYSWSYSYNEQSFRRQFGSPTLPQAVEAGLVDVLRDTMSFATLIDPYSNVPHTFTKVYQGDSTLRAAGTLTEWYAGAITLATGLEHRELRSTGVSNVQTPPPLITRRQKIDSAYAEATVPLVSPAQKLTALHALDAQVAVRHERFDMKPSKFDSTVPTFGLRWQPIDQLIVRSSYGRGFRAPNYSQIAPPILSTAPTQVNDPRRGGQLVDIDTLSGGNPNLRPETSRNLNAGIVWLPHFAPGLRLSADWYKIEKKNNLTSLSAQAILDEEANFSERIIRATPAPGDPFGVGEVLQVNTTMMNMLKMETAGLDLGARYRFSAGEVGDFDLGLNATFTDYYREQTAFNTPLVDWVGIPSRNSSGPIDSRINANLLWQRRQWSAGWSAQYYDSYQINPSSTTAVLSQGRSGKVSSQTYHDAFVRYHLPQRKGLLAGTEFSFGVKNLFNQAPPIDMSRRHYYSSFGDPRMRRFYANVKKTF